MTESNPYQAPEQSEQWPNARPRSRFRRLVGLMAELPSISAVVSFAFIERAPAIFIPLFVILLAAGVILSLVAIRWSRDASS